jgi:signal transduction histidine kinase/DNA-binding response OmpR family regulator
MIAPTVGCSLLHAQPSIPTFTIDEEDYDVIHLKDVLYVFTEPDEKEAAYLTLDRAGVVLPDNHKDGVWSAITLENTSGNVIHTALWFCSHADSVRMYSFQNGIFTGQQHNSWALRPPRQRLPSSNHHLMLNFDPAQRQTLYFQTFYQENTPASHHRNLSIQPSILLFNRILHKFTWQAFYSGLLLLLCVIGCFMYRMFTERIFLFYAGLMASFTLYFASRYGLLLLFTSYSIINTPFIPMMLGITGVVCFTSLFIIDFIGLRNRLPRYYLIFAAFSAIISVFPYLSIGLFDHFNRFSLIYDSLLGVWGITAMIPIIWLAIIRDTAARSLLLPIGILFFSSLIFIFSNYLVGASSMLAKYSFQTGLLIFSGILFFVVFEKISTLRRKKSQLEELSKLKSRFFTNLSHEFRTPLTLIMGPLQQLLKSQPGQRDKALLETAYQSAQNQLNLVNELLELSRLEAGKMSLKARKQDIVAHMKAVVYAYESLAEEKEVDYQLIGPGQPVEVFYDAEKIEKVVNNLLSNAFKFTPVGGAITVEVSKKSKQVLISVSDTGAGIPINQLSKVFDRFFQGKQEGHTQQSSGVGLNLAKEIVQLHHGSIQVQSRPGQGTQFEVLLPLGRQHLEAHEILHEASPILPSLPGPFVDKPRELLRQPQTNSQPLPNVLIIEDNTEVRAFICQRLAAHFQVAEAEDGASGIQKALDQLPDLIVSDVMMPHKNGYEVCATLKADVRTSHIPIILLTAKAEKEEKLEGLQTGADDYLAKPFDAEELVIRMANLIQIRQHLRARFATAIELKPSEVSANSVDQEFLEHAMQIIEENMSNEHFKVDFLAREIGMSRPHLNRKLRALVNQSTNQFIQSVRLQRAASLLRQQAGNVSEIAFQTGFSSTAYFSKCFKEKYGETPGSFSRKE